MNRPLHQKDDKMTPKGKSEFTEDIYFFEYIRERDRIPFTQMARIRMGKNVKFSVELDWLEKNYINSNHIMRQRNKKINDILDNETG